MPPRGHNPLEGMGELFLSLVWDHCDSHELASWLKIILLGAARGGDAEMVSALIKAGAASSNLRSGDSTTPLHVAAQRGSLDVVSSLLNTSVIRDVNEQLPSNGETPLYVAVDFGHANVAFALARAGGDVNLANDRGWSPLICAAFHGGAKLVNGLLVRGAQVDAKKPNGDQALHVAVRHCHLGVVKALLQGKACPGTRGEDDMSPVDWAVEDVDTETLCELLASATNLNRLDDGGESAMDIAVRDGRPEAIHVLADAGVDIGSPTGDGKLPLQNACYYSVSSSVQALLRRNADETVRNDEDDLPHEIVGRGLSEEERDDDVIEEIRKMLARAPADRVWRRRGWLAMLKARKRAADQELTLDQQHLRKDNDDGAGNNQGGEAEPPSVLSSRRKLADQGKWATDGVIPVHPTRKKFLWVVTKMVDVADELLFRNIVSYL